MSGAVWITPAVGGPFAATTEMELVRSDTVSPADGAFALVALTNGYVVRVDDVGPLTSSSAAPALPVSCAR